MYVCVCVCVCGVSSFALASPWLHGGSGVVTKKCPVMNMHASRYRVVRRHWTRQTLRVNFLPDVLDIAQPELALALILLSEWCSPKHSSPFLLCIELCARRGSVKRYRSQEEGRAGKECWVEPQVSKAVRNVCGVGMSCRCKKYKWTLELLSPKVANTWQRPRLL